MDYERKENQFNSKGGFFLEIASLFIIFILVLLSGVAFYFYEEVGRLYDDKAEIMARLKDYENQLKRSDFRELRKISSDQKQLREQLSDLVDRFEGVEAGVSEQKITELRERLGKLEKQFQKSKTSKHKPKLAAVSTNSRFKVVDGLRVDLISCADKMMYFYCDVQVKDLSKSDRKIEISNENTFVKSYSDRIYQISSFSIGSQLNKDIRDKTRVLLNRVQPLRLRFKFFDPPSGIKAYAAAQFNIDGKAVRFERFKVAN